ncbi:MAG: hypothetical protein GX614_02640 [Sandaracinaceae bacterium]|nr:hypothetical protein [Sandaracinaceae bacterium]
MKKIGIIGAGGFGLAIARAALENDCEVRVWSRRETIAIEGVRLVHSFSELSETTLIYVAIPSPHVRTIAEKLAPALDGRHRLVHVSRGLPGPGLMTLSEVLRTETPCRRVGALAGPLVAEELAKRSESSAIVGTRFPEIVDAVRLSIGGARLRIEGTEDIRGVEIASAVVGVLSVALGMATALGIGPGGQAYLSARGMEEGALLVESLGGRPRTLFGLAGFADLVAVVAGDNRPEWRFGRELALGHSKSLAAKNAGAHLESISMAERLAEHARKHGIHAPICEALAKTFGGDYAPAEAIERILATRGVGIVKR